MEDTARRFAAALGAGLTGYILFFVPAIAAAVTLRLSPNGVDDTPQLQAALETCAGAVTPCRIALNRGTFHTNFLLVSNFRGEIRGQGAGVTIVQPLLDRYLRPSLRPFDAPPTLSAPYPALLHFTDGGDIALVNLTLNFPSSMKMLGWYQHFWSTMLSAVLVDGGMDDRARLSMTGVEVLANPRCGVFTFRSNVMAAVLFGGRQAYFPVLTSVHPERLGGGTFIARRNFIRDTGIGFAVHEAAHLDVRIVDNDVQHTRRNAVSLFDLGGSRVRVVDNRIAAEGTIINNYRGFMEFDPLRAPPSTEPSNFLIAQNSITLTGLGTFGADPIVTVDWLGFAADEKPNAGIDTWSIRDNDIVLDVAGRGITVLGDRGHTLVAHNRIWGGAGMQGLIIEGSVGTRTNRNTFFDFPSDQPTVVLGVFARQCRVIEPASVVLDNGQDDYVVAREVRRTVP
jgi:hypothetical protein